MFFREKESCVAVNLFETFKYFVVVSIELASFWQIIILFSSRLNTFNSVFPFKQGICLGLVGWCGCSPPRPPQFSKHLRAGNVVICKCSQSKWKAFWGLRWEMHQYVQWRILAKAWHRGGYSDGENSLWSKSKNTWKIVRKMFSFSPVYKIIVVMYGPQNRSIKWSNLKTRNTLQFCFFWKSFLLLT